MWGCHSHSGHTCLYGHYYPFRILAPSSVSSWFLLAFTSLLFWISRRNELLLKIVSTTCISYNCRYPGTALFVKYDCNSYSLVSVAVSLPSTLLFVWWGSTQAPPKKSYTTWCQRQISMNPCLKNYHLSYRRPCAAKSGLHAPKRSRMLVPANHSTHPISGWWRDDIGSTVRILLSHMA
jgi:hypothetical protein